MQLQLHIKVAYQQLGCAVVYCCAALLLWSKGKGIQDKERLQHAAAEAIIIRVI